MTPQEKARELHHKYCTMMSHCDDAVECALIAVDEILSKRLVAHLPWQEVEYWEKVKIEIKKL